MMIQKTGIVHGRFQPFHLDHLNYAMEAKKHCDYLIVGVTNSDPTFTNKDLTNPDRSLKSANPLSYFERLIMIREALLETGMSYDCFDIVPFPINRPELIAFYVPTDATHYITIYDDWGRRKLHLLESQGFKVVVLWDKRPEDKNVSATEIRRNIAMGVQWEHLLPTAVVRVIEEYQLEKRIRESFSLTPAEYQL